MLHLQSETDARWLRWVDSHLDDILIDHAHCERKAASTAMNLIHAYALDRKLGQEMAEIVREELEHYEMVLDLLERRGIDYRRLRPPPYGSELHTQVRGGEPQRVVDRLLIASLIEARSCERFRMLAQHVRQRDAELAEFYAGLFESEARHSTTYVRLAENYAERAEVMQRLGELSEFETEVLRRDCGLPRMHS